MNLPSRIDESLISPDLNQVGMELAEAVLDSTMNDGLLKEMPGFNILYGLGNVYTTWSDRVFTNKLLVFFSSFKDIPAHLRQTQIDKIDKDQKYRLKVGEKVLSIIDSAEDKIAAEIIGLVMREFINQTITYDDFLRCSSIINRVPIDYLLDVYKKGYGEVDLELAGELVASGLFVQNPIILELVEREHSDLTLGRTHENVLNQEPQTASISVHGNMIVGIMQKHKFK